MFAIQNWTKMGMCCHYHTIVKATYFPKLDAGVASFPVSLPLRMHVYSCAYNKFLLEGLASSKVIHIRVRPGARGKESRKKFYLRLALARSAQARPNNLAASMDPYVIMAIT